MKRAFIALVILLAPAAAQACAVCGTALEQNRFAFLATTIVLSLLPLALIGAGVFWLYRQARRMDVRPSDRQGAETT